MQDTGYKILDTGYKILDTRCDLEDNRKEIQVELQFCTFGIDLYTGN